MEGDDEYSILIKSLKKVSEQRNQQRKKRGLEIIEKTKNSLLNNVKRKKLSHMTSRKSITDELVDTYNKKEGLLQSILDECKNQLDGVKSDLKKSTTESEELTVQIQKAVQDYEEGLRKMQMKNAEEWDQFHKWADDEIDKAAHIANEAFQSVSLAKLLSMTKDLLGTISPDSNNSYSPALPEIPENSESGLIPPSSNGRNGGKGSSSSHSRNSKSKNCDSPDITDNLMLSPLIDFSTPDLIGGGFLKDGNDTITSEFFGDLLNVDLV